jgi:hypothetical protein
VGRLLRRWADHIDPANAPRKSGYSYTVELGSRTKYPNGIAVHVDGTGQPFWVMPVDGDRRFTEAATDWRIGKEKLSDMMETHGEPVQEDR